MNQRHALCAQIHSAGMRRDSLEVKRLMRQLIELDQTMQIPTVQICEETPMVGGLIYLPTQCFFDNCHLDVRGGVGTVKTTAVDDGVVVITTYEHPERSYIWEVLAREQLDLQHDYPNQWAYPDPCL